MSRQSPRQNRQRKSQGGSGMWLIIIGLVLMLGSIVLSVFTPLQLPATGQLVLMGFGIVLFIIGVIMTSVTRFYHRTSAYRAFVRTGRGGAKAVVDGGAFVIPILHEVTYVSLESMRFEVGRGGSDALITSDHIRANITAEFFVKVPKEPNAVLNAATSLGAGAANQDAIRSLLDKKFESTLRTVAASKTLNELLVDRAGFIKAVIEDLKQDIERNGLELESVTISHLDETPRDTLRVGGIWDTQGERTVTETVAREQVETNRLKQEAERAIAQEKVATDSIIYQQDVERARAEAEKNRTIQIVRAQADQEATTAAAEQARLAGLAEVERNRTLEVAEVQRQQAVAVANEAREREVRAAEIATQQAIEVSEREKAIAIATAETRRAQAQAEQLAAEAEKTEQDQRVRTVEVTAAAERQARQQVIQAEADADKQRIQRETDAKVEAFKLTTTAQAEEQAAQHEARATRERAQAQSEAAVLVAAGRRAEEMIPVEVERERVAVEAQRVAVLRDELSSKAEYETIARDLEIALRQIEANRDVQIAAANALAQAFQGSNMNLWGDAGTVLRMSEAFYRGQQNGHMIEGVMAGTPKEVKDAFSEFAALAANYLKDKMGVPVDPQQLENILREEQSKKAEPARNNGS